MQTIDNSKLDVEKKSNQKLGGKTIKIDLDYLQQIAYKYKIVKDKTQRSLTNRQISLMECKYSKSKNGKNFLWTLCTELLRFWKENVSNKVDAGFN